MVPYSADSRIVTQTDQLACRAAIRSGSKSFFAASLLLPRRVREPARALYAFCRLADDAVDDGRTDPMAELRERLARVYAGWPADCPADRALAEAVSVHRIPREFPEALLEGFQWDIERRRYEDIEQLQAYAARVAGAVGEMMAHLMDRRSPDALARARDLGIAMQLTNIARDVGEDARAGRLYLPTNWLHQAGVDAQEWLKSPVFTPQIAQVIRRLLQVADSFYVRADAGIALLPRDCRSAIAAARHLYAHIGHELIHHGCDSISTRTVVPTRRKLWIVSKALLGGPGAMSSGMFAGLGARTAWLVELFERLERRDREPSDRIA
jgi:15-cis-phytoene synthase